jgi:antitoxin component YwqK of YwqJK toxin-antitoxin module
LRFANCKLQTANCKNIFLKKLFLFLFIICASNLFGQQLRERVEEKKYTQAEVTDSVYGIIKYEKLNPALGGDSLRYDVKGYSALGWYKDYYTNGKLLHKGYYNDGQLKIYKNYWDNDTIEREFRVTDLSRHNMKTYYRNGQLKSEIDYYKSNPIKEVNYYPNGQLEFIEEYNKDMEYYLQSKSFYENGFPQTSLELTDSKKKIYSKKEYYPNGKIKEEGTLKFSLAVQDYRKEGKWLTYNEEGKLIEENYYINGELNKTVKVSDK